MKDWQLEFSNPESMFEEIQRLRNENERDQFSLEKGIKYFVSDCPACTEYFKVPTGSFENVLCTECNSSGGLDSISISSFASGLKNDLDNFINWYVRMNQKHPFTYPIEHLGVDSKFNVMFQEFCKSDIRNDTTNVN
ncbi:MAG: hypothetical protein HRU38_23355 [Saccharospirillaceae bacterium]|nr:hypothetical protein [Saccharospirillaceae bacterium]